MLPKNNIHPLLTLCSEIIIQVICSQMVISIRLTLDVWNYHLGRLQRFSPYVLSAAIR